MRLKRAILPDGNHIIDTGLPQRGIKPAGMELHTHMVKRLFEAAEDDEKMRNGVVRRLSKALVNTILDMAKRDEALETIAQSIDKELGESASSMSFSERASAEGEIWFDIGLREFMEYTDQAFAISHRLAIGTFGGAPDSEYTEEQTIEEDTEIHEQWSDMNEESS